MSFGDLAQTPVLPPAVVVLRGALGEEPDGVDGRHAAPVADAVLEELEAEAGVVREAVGKDVPELRERGRGSECVCKRERKREERDSCQSEWVGVV
jgi:hypothetical protein